MENMRLLGHTADQKDLRNRIYHSANVEFVL